jgi:hypothetical protein
MSGTLSATPLVVNTEVRENERCSESILRRLRKFEHGRVADQLSRHFCLKGGAMC